MNIMNKSEESEFWGQIKAQAIRDCEKAKLDAILHRAGICENSCCRDMMDEYYSARYEHYQVLKNGLVIFGDEKKYEWPSQKREN